jgi:hypothetical protein
MIPHHKLWDVVHWNTFFPTLPRFAQYDPKYHADLSVVNSSVIIDDRTYDHNTVTYNVTWDIWAKDIITNPPPFSRPPLQGWSMYKRLHRLIQEDTIEWEKLTDAHTLSMYQVILQGALRPHPFLQAIIDREQYRLTNQGLGKYMAFHLRVEPDMSVCNVCSDFKVKNATDIMNAVYDQFPEPPVDIVLLQFNRATMEELVEEKNNPKFEKYDVETIRLNEYNLQQINIIIRDGMWNGTVKVVENGSQNFLLPTDNNNDEDEYYKYFQKYSNIAGSIINLFLAIQSNVFIGTEVSTYSSQAVNSRFYRQNRENYFYRPEGLYPVTPPNSKKPHQFICKEQ